MIDLTIDMLSWCYPLDVVRWLSNQASQDGDYMVLEVVSSNVGGHVLSVPRAEYEASVIYSAQMHIPALVSFMDDWDSVGWNDGILTFFCKNKFSEHINCKYNPRLGEQSTLWTREQLELIWKSNNASAG